MDRRDRRKIRSIPANGWSGFGVGKALISLFQQVRLAQHSHVEVVGNSNSLSVLDVTPNSLASRCQYSLPCLSSQADWIVRSQNTVLVIRSELQVEFNEATGRHVGLVSFSRFLELVGAESETIETAKKSDSPIPVRAESSYSQIEQIVRTGNQLADFFRVKNEDGFSLVEITRDSIRDKLHDLKFQCEDALLSLNPGIVQDTIKGIVDASKRISELSDEYTRIRKVTHRLKIDNLFELNVKRFLRLIDILDRIVNI